MVVLELSHAEVSYCASAPSLPVSTFEWTKASFCLVFVAFSHYRPLTSFLLSCNPCPLPFSHCLLPFRHRLLYFCYCLSPFTYSLLPFICCFCISVAAYCHLLHFSHCLSPVACYRSGSKGQKEWRHMPASKSYHLHVGTQTDSSLSFNVLPPIDSFTVAVHDALFTGVFLQEAAAKRYISLNKAATPYRSVCSVAEYGHQLKDLRVYLPCTNMLLVLLYTCADIHLYSYSLVPVLPSLVLSMEPTRPCVSGYVWSVMMSGTLS